MGYVLVLEDDQDDLYLTSRAIKRSGLTAVVRYASSGTQAQTTLGEFGAPDLVIMDAHMPEFVGTEFIGRAKQSVTNRNVPFVVFSSSIGPYEEEALTQAGADQVVSKPVDLEQYEAAIRQIIHQWLPVANVAKAA